MIYWICENSSINKNLEECVKDEKTNKQVSER